MPDRRALTSSRTRLVLNRTCAAMIVYVPKPSLKTPLPPPWRLLRIGFTMSNVLAKKTSVARAMTISGTMMLTYVSTS